MRPAEHGPGTAGSEATDPHGPARTTGGRPPDTDTADANAGGAEWTDWPHCQVCRRSRERGRRTPLPLQWIDRSYAEALQEVRVAQNGVQFLLAFLMAAPFNSQFDMNTVVQRELYVTSLVTGAFSTALLIAPAPYHRMLWGRRMKPEMFRAASHFARYGLGLMLIAIISALWLVLTYLMDTRLATIAACAIGGWFVAWWYAGPLLTFLNCRRIALRGRHRAR